MANKVIVSREKLVAVADAIRGKTETTDSLTLDAMPMAISTIKVSNEDAIVNRSISGAYANDSITSIEQFAFRGCSKLTSISFPNVTSIATNGVYGCSALTSFNLPKVKTIADNVFNGCSALTSAVLPSVTSIGSYAFRYCHKMTVVDLAVIPNLAANCLNQCNLFATLILRKSDTIVTLASTSAFGNTPFAAGKSGGKVYVPSALIETYKTATNWATLVAAGTCEFVALEGSEYE